MKRSFDGPAYALPKAFRWFAGQAVHLMGDTRGIVAPLLIDDSVIGTLAVQSDSLVEGDIPAITAFAYQIAAAWHRALCR